MNACYCLCDDSVFQSGPERHNPRYCRYFAESVPLPSIHHVFCPWRAGVVTVSLGTQETPALLSSPLLTTSSARRGAQKTVTAALSCSFVVCKGVKGARLAWAMHGPGGG